jgi:hypothetical protein
MNGSEIFERLCRRFGTPAANSITEKFYLKLADIVEAEGDRAYAIIRSAAADSVGKSAPDRYFAKVATLRLRESGVGGIEGDL